MVSFGTTLRPPLVRRKVQSIIVHENYAAHKHDDDIAVVKLSTTVLFSEDVHRVCLPSATFEVVPKSKVFVTGWGALKANGEYLSQNNKAKNIYMPNLLYNGDTK
jgi:secreted trypsin-like serine protease